MKTRLYIFFSSSGGNISRLTTFSHLLLFLPFLAPGAEGEEEIQKQEKPLSCVFFPFSTAAVIDPAEARDSTKLQN